MNSLILHHFALSPFSEKVRLILGAKGLSWQSVEVPMVLPKPDVVALTGGYRRTPFLQIGADIYCDTALMCKVIDRVAPQLPLYPPALSGLAEIVAQWADASLFWTAVPFTSQPQNRPEMFPDLSPEFIKTLYEDRAAMTGKLRRASPVDGAAQLSTYLGRLQNLLADGRAFLLGSQPSIADFSVAQSLWYMSRASRAAAVLDAYPDIVAWFARMRAFGHGTASTISSSQAIAIAAGATTHAPADCDPGGGFAQGDSIRVTPTDYAEDPVTGQLVGLTNDEVVIERVDPRAGRVHVHFPRIGFRLANASE